MRLTREDVLKHAKGRALHKLTFAHLRGTMQMFSQAPIVMVCEGGKVNILKDRNAIYWHLKRDTNGLVDEAELNKPKACIVHPEIMAERDLPIPCAPGGKVPVCLECHDLVMAKDKTRTTQLFHAYKASKVGGERIAQQKRLN